MDEAWINETLRIGGRGLGSPWRYVIEQGFYPFGVWIGNLGKGGIVSLVSPLQALRVIGLEILSDECFGLFLMGLDVMKRFGECPHDFGDQCSSLLHRLFTCDNSVHVIGNLERPDIDQVSKTHLLRLSYQRFSKECELSNIA